MTINIIGTCIIDPKRTGYVSDGQENTNCNACPAYPCDITGEPEDFEPGFHCRNLGIMDCGACNDCSPSYGVEPFRFLLEGYMNPVSDEIPF